MNARAHATCCFVAGGTPPEPMSDDEEHDKTEEAADDPHATMTHRHITREQAEVSSVGAPLPSLPFRHRYVVGPMVGASDLAFRLLMRRHGADLCYTEMLFSERLAQDAEYRRRKLQSCAEDRPLVVQLQGNEPEVVAAAARHVVTSCACDAIDLNLGCPLPEAERQCFGAYLLERSQWPRVMAVVSALVSAVSLPIFCKIRLLDDEGSGRREGTIATTIAFCRLLQAAGCSLIAIHGRHRPRAGEFRGERQRTAADLEAIRAVAAAVDVPVLSNGNTDGPEDVERNLQTTCAAGVMCAEGVLRNPLLFEQAHADCEGGRASEQRGHERDGWERPAGRVDAQRALGGVALEYLNLARAYPPENVSLVRSHVMWMLGKSGKGHRCHFEWLGPFTAVQLRCALTEAADVDALEQVVRSTLLPSQQSESL